MPIAGIHRCRAPEQGPPNEFERDEQSVIRPMQIIP